MCIAQLKSLIKENKDSPLDEVISRGALKLDDNHIETVSFIFWLCYMAEYDLDDILRESFRLAKKAYPVNDFIIKVLKEEHNLDIKKIDPDNPDYLPNEITFGDRIKILKNSFGDDQAVKLLWKLKGLRDDISHGRIKKLSYNNKNLLLRETRENLLIDYFNQMLNENFFKSKTWNKLDEKAQEEVKRKYNELKDQIKFSN